MGLLDSVGTVAALCTTGAFIPQIVKIRRQGAEDLSFSMLLIYLTGVLLWLMYGMLLHAAAVIWANAATSLLVAVALVLKVTLPAGCRPSKEREPDPGRSNLSARGVQPEA
jgi:MtN3 and saliva related transmembrane protein